MTLLAFSSQNPDSLKQRILTHDKAVPRYTSYPAAPCFTTDFNVQTHLSWLAQIPEDEPISLYIHIPFCSQLCYYCGCHTFVTSHQDIIRDYCLSLFDEISLIKKYVPQNLKVSHLHFGGGSPTILPPLFLRDLIEKLHSTFQFSDNAEIAIEADPRQLNEEKIKSYIEIGINRVSLGVQDVNEKVLAAVNRPQPFSLSQRAIEQFRKYGLRDINIDLMYGLTGQTVASIKDTIETVLSLKPERIAFFGYAHVPWMKKSMSLFKDIPLPDANLRFDMQETCRNILENSGYISVGIDHFALPSNSMAQAFKERRLERNFQGYTIDAAKTLIGLGASAISQFQQGYSQNTPDLRFYRQQISQNQLPVYKGLEITSDDLVSRAVIRQIMCYMQVDLKEIIQEFQLPLAYFSADLQRLEPLLNDGLATFNNMVVTAVHPQTARLTAYGFDRTTQIDLLQKKHSQAI
jgi:oxygen-independent coproporphyrinogen-3 oxidase